MIKKQTVYVPVDVEDELPPVEEVVTMICSKFGRDGINGSLYTGWRDVSGAYTYYSESGETKDFDNNPDYWWVTHWLKEVELYTFTAEELEEVIKKAYFQGSFDNSAISRVMYKEIKTFKDDKEYIESLEIK